MSTANRSRLLSLTIKNIGCIGEDPVEISLDKIVCLVGKNNSGKTTVLRAYELARGDEPFISTRDRSLLAKEKSPSEIILDIHIPDNIANINKDWKIIQGDLKIVRSRWQWSPPLYAMVRSTWDPKGGEHGTGGWSQDKKAGGLDNVFKSRLPRAIRVGSLDDAEKTEKTLLALALQPLIDKLNLEKKEATSRLTQAIKSISEYINQETQSHQEGFNSISKQVTDGFKTVFPELSVSLDIQSGPMAIDTEKLIKSGSGISIQDGEITTSLSQQGTGARRALFWAMLQVHNKLERESEIRGSYLKKLEDEMASLKKEEEKKTVKEQRRAEIADRKRVLDALINQHNEGAAIPRDEEDPSLPGYLLLIDEPENALHPLAAKAAQRHLYNLAENPDWQVMMTTHSPYFINPFEDHTTIIRLERGTSKEKKVNIRTYQSESVSFEGDEKFRLHALQQIDPSLSEIFFGSFPIIVEGDTEHAAFIAAIVEENHEFLDKVTIIRARGKSILTPLIKVMTHFKIHFSMIHDCDSPYNKKGNNNGMWTENEKIRNAILQARDSGLTVRHRVSIPDFERFLDGDEESKDKPLNAFTRIKADQHLKHKVQSLLRQLIEGDIHDCIDPSLITEENNYLSILKKDVCQWAISKGQHDEIKFFGKPA